MFELLKLLQEILKSTVKQIHPLICPKTSHVHPNTVSGSTCAHVIRVSETSLWTLGTPVLVCIL